MLFTRLLVDLLVWASIEHPDWEIALDEGRVKSPRRMREGDHLVTLADGVHARGSFHYEGLAQDLLLFIRQPDGLARKDDYIQDGDHPAWKAIAAKWESLHPGATSGRRWHDANHCSLFEGRKEGPLP